jgi:hypothetical protein
MCTSKGTDIDNCLTRKSSSSLSYQSRGQFGIGSSLIYIYMKGFEKIHAKLFTKSMWFSHVSIR